METRSLVSGFKNTILTKKPLRLSTSLKLLSSIARSWQLLQIQTMNLSNNSLYKESLATLRGEYLSLTILLSLIQTIHLKKRLLTPKTINCSISFPCKEKKKRRSMTPTICRLLQKSNPRKRRTGNWSWYMERRQSYLQSKKRLSRSGNQRLFKRLRQKLKKTRSPKS